MEIVSIKNIQMNKWCLGYSVLVLTEVLLEVLIVLIFLNTAFFLY